jgi:Domain of unknown function (DUF4440)
VISRTFGAVAAQHNPVSLERSRSFVLWEVNVTRSTSIDQRDLAAPVPPDAHEPIHAALLAISRAWRERRYEALGNCFAPDMVFALPSFASRLLGRDAIVASYREFMDRVTLTDYREDVATVDRWGDTAMTLFRWQMEWLAEGVSNQAAGHDAFLFRRIQTAAPDQPEHWVAVWRTMAFDREPTDSRAPAL